MSSLRAQPQQDLVLLDSLDEGLILHNLKRRFLETPDGAGVYTAIGTILVSLNPYATFPLYTMDKIHDYHARGNRTLSPHVYEVADRALRPLLEYREPQSILISGESGAGKTWNTKPVAVPRNT